MEASCKLGHFSGLQIGLSSSCESSGLVVSRNCRKTISKDYVCFSPQQGEPFTHGRVRAEAWEGSTRIQKPSVAQVCSYSHLPAREYSVQSREASQVTGRARAIVLP